MPALAPKMHVAAKKMLSTATLAVIDFDVKTHCISLLRFEVEMDATISVVGKFVSEYERPNIHGVRSLITSSTLM